MPKLAPFGIYAPDISDLDRDHTSSILNVLPRADGYGPHPSLDPLSDALAARCRGMFFARKRDGSILIFAGTETRLYLMSNTDYSWTDVSKGGSAYSALSSDAHWQFAQFADVVIAVQANVAPQSYNLTSSSAFADLGGSPPQAAYIGVINRFVVLGGLLNEPYRVQWSGLNAITTWTSGTSYSDYQDQPDGGIVRGISGGEQGFLFQDTAIRRMTWVPGADIVFQIDRLGTEIGLLAPYSLIRSEARTFFLSSQGFMQLEPTGQLIPIGKEAVDRTFAGSVDKSALSLVLGASSPRSTVVTWSAKTIDDAAQQNLFNRLWNYDYALKRWTPADVTGEFLASVARPGATLESLDAIAPGVVAISGAANNGSGLVRLTVASTTGWTTGDFKSVSAVTGTTEANGHWTITVIDGTHIDLQGSTYANAYVSGGIVGGSVDDMDFSLDDLATVALTELGAVDTSHRVGFLVGSALEAVLETAEQSGQGRRVYINSVEPVSDAPTIYGRAILRQTLSDTATDEGEENAKNDDGVIPLMDEARFLRVRCRIPAGEEWTFASGVMPEFGLGGRA